MESTADPVLFFAGDGDDDRNMKMKRQEPMVRVSKVSDRVILTLAVLTIAGLSLPGCKAESGGSGERNVLGYGLNLELAGPSPGHSHEFLFTTSELEAENTIAGNTSSFANHAHFLTVLGSQLADFGDDGSLINGTTISASALPGVTDHTHDWNLEGD